MSKNLTHKSLAIGAGLALIVSGLAAVPAQADANGPLTLVPTAGSTFNSILQSGITLQSEVDPGQAALGRDDSTRIYVIENPGGAEVSLEYDRVGLASAFTAVAPSFATNRTGLGDFGAFGFATVAGSGTIASQTLTSSSEFIAIGQKNPDSAPASRISIATGETDKNVTLTVRTFLDANGNGKQDTFEPGSTVETVVLYAPANVSAVTTIDKLTFSSDAYRTSVVFGNDINPFMVTERTGIRIIKDGATQALEGNTTTNISPTTVSASRITSGLGIEKNTLTAGVTSGGADRTGFNLDTTNDNGAGNGFYTAITFYDTGGSTFLNTAGDRLVRMGSPSSVADLTAGSSAAASHIAVRTSSGVNQKVMTSGTTEVVVRSGSKTVSFGAQVEGDVEGTALRVANVEVRATITATTLDSSTSITVTGSNGTLTKTSSALVATARTNSLGQVDFVLTSSSGKKGDDVRVLLEFKDSFGAYSSEGSSVGDLDIAFVDAAPVVAVKPAQYVSGANPTVTVAVTDQFGQPISIVSNERLSVFASAYIGGVESSKTYSERVTVVDGQATFTFANFAPAGSTAELRVVTYKGAQTSLDQNKSVIVYNTSDTDSITVANSFTTDITYTDFIVGSNKDAAVAASLKATGLDDDETRVKITGNVQNDDGNGQPGAAVTVAADGVLFYDDGAGLYAEDSIVVYANEFGAFDVFAYAHILNTAGQDVTITSDGVSDTTKLITALPSGNLTSKTLKFDWNFPAQLAMNTTYAVTASLSDVWGNPVETEGVAVKFEGNGSVQVNGVDPATSKDFNRNGEVTVFVRSIKDIAGPGEVTAKLESASYAIARAADGTAQTALLGSLLTNSTDDEQTAWDETVFRSELIVEVDVKESAADFAADAKLNAGSFNGYVAVYAKGYKGATLSWKIAGKWFKTTVTEDYQVFQRKTVATGLDVNVDLYINGVKPAAFSKVVTTK